MEVNDNGSAVEKDVSSANDNASVQDVNQETKQEKPEVVPLAKYKETLEDKYALKKQKEALEIRLKELERQNIAKSGDKEAEIAHWKKEAEEATNRAQKFSESVVFSNRFNAVKSEALKLGLRAEAEADLELIDMNDVETEMTNTGRFIVKDADQKAQMLKRLKPHWFKDNTTPTVNSGGGSRTVDKAEPITPSKLLELEKAYKAGKITQDAYYGAYRQYQEQRSKPRIFN